jgi:DNA-directed RNA polymerase specialized sigma24 family protein
MSSGSVTKLIGRVKAGDAAAAQELLGRYFRRLLGVARVRLHGKYLGAADEEDVVQSALVGFFLGAEKGQFSQLHDRDDLWHLLVKITTHKAHKLAKHDEAQKRKPGGCPGAAPAAAGSLEVVDPKAAPDVEVLAEEEIERLLGLLGDSQLRSIAVMKWQDYTNEEIAAMLGCTTRTIERKLRLIRTLWAEENPA